MFSLHFFNGATHRAVLGYVKLPPNLLSFKPPEKEHEIFLGQSFPALRPLFIRWCHGSGCSVLNGLIIRFNCHSSVQKLMIGRHSSPLKFLQRMLGPGYRRGFPRQIVIAGLFHSSMTSAQMRLRGNSL